jgi:putative membrane protein
MVGRTDDILAPEEQARVEAAIAAVERGSAAELVVVIARHSASYAVYAALWAACVALLAGWIGAFVAPSLHVSYLAILQGLVLLGAGLLLHLTPLGMMLVPASIKQARAASLARLEFANLVNNRTSGRDGVLLFLSVAEHYVEIIADNGIAAAIPEDRWQILVSHFVARTKGERIVDGLHELIKECGAILAEQFPPRPGQSNELPDQVKQI